MLDMPQDFEAMSVVDFAQWWLTYKPIDPPENAVTRDGNISGCVVFRRAPFQVQLFIGDAGSTAPEHSHPNVDSFEAHIAGQVDFATSRGEWNSKFARILPSENHVAVAGPSGAAFFSIQKWLNGVPPTSVADDWLGAPIDEKHEGKLKVMNADA